MEALQKAYEARNKKLNKIEKVKELKNPQEAYDKISEYAKSGYDSIPDEEMFVLQIQVEHTELVKE